jgi:hypothetical protein
MSQKLKEDIIMDSRSTTNLFANPKLVENVQKSSNMLELAMNAGTHRT